MTSRRGGDESTLGVLGGMGPAATARFYQVLVDETPASADQDHFHVVIDSDPKIPDRTEAMVGSGPDPTPHLTRSAQRLVDAGADLIAMPCNAAHHYVDEVAAHVPVPTIHQIQATVERALDRTGSGARFGLLATEGTLQMEVYHRELDGRDAAIVPLPQDRRKRVTEVLYEIKAGRLEGARAELVGAGEALLEEGADAVIGGCTEVPLVLSEEDAPFPLVDSTLSLAKACVRALASPEEALPRADRTQG